ncbi:MAG TPA: AGE family epimerase/isomerase [Bacteroidota bacterium]|nr:AGE family epimerase/isomerase [Bacteroidota bacterium]
MIDFHARAAQYRKALLDDVIPFWDRHSPDEQCGGYFSCLARDGAVYDGDKYVWPQCRQAWTYAMLYNRLERRPAWLAMSAGGIRFLRAHGMDADGLWYFALTREGKPLVQPYNIITDCLAAMAFAEYALASGDDACRDIALQTYRNILVRLENPKGRYAKAFPGTRPLRAFALPMILLNLTSAVAWLLPPAEVDETLRRCADEITGLFLDREKGVFFEHVAPGGTHVDTFDGRLINPGHGIEGTWFLMEAAGRLGDTSITARAVDALIATLRFGWDDRYGGIFGFRDAAGKPLQQLDWDQKFWWVHVEALVALAMGYRLTGSAECLAWLEKVHDYTWGHFPDPKYGEWFGYLDRRGDVLIPLKGGKWKGCFHIPRGLFMCSEIFAALAAHGPGSRK